MREGLGGGFLATDLHRFTQICFGGWRVSLSIGNFLYGLGVVD